MGTVYLNGKFTAQRTTGVQRVAMQLVLALDAALARQAPPAGERWVLLYPAGGQPPPLRAIEARALPGSGSSLHLWEQLSLPWAARDGLLLNLAGAAPWLARRQIGTLHDAAVFEQAQAYRPAFRLWYRALFRHLARRAVRLLTVSRFSQGRLAQHLGLPPQAIGVLPNGCEHLDDVVADTGVLQRLGLVGQPFFLAVGSDNPTKNLDRLRQAHRLLPAAQRPRLVMVGGGQAQVFAAAGATGAGEPAEGVIQAGPCQDAELKALYQHALALVFPSLYEGFGLPPLEAMRCGCPVIAGRAAALPEVCGEAAWLVDPLDVNALAQAMARLASDAAERQRWRERGLAHAQHWRWSDAAGALLAEVRALA